MDDFQIPEDRMRAEQELLQRINAAAQRYRDAVAHAK
jgi:hypothetical protein